MLIRLPAEKTFTPGPGRCIYCWPETDPPGPLTREHIIAHKLGGKLILHRASCKPCADLINREIENPALGQMWVSPRAHLGLPSSKPKTTLRIGRWTDNGEKMPSNFEGLNLRFEEVPLSDRAFVIMLGQLPPPGIFEGRTATSSFRIVGMDYHLSGPPVVPNTGEGAAIFERFSPAVLGRFLAKVAHGVAVAELGLDAFEPFLPAVIKGEEAWLPHYVGSAARRGRKHAALHRIRLETKRGLLVAEVQLFARFGLRPYQVVVGKLSGKLARWHRSSRMTVSTPPQ